MLQKKVVPSAQLHFIGQTESRAAAKVESREDRDVPKCRARWGLLPGEGRSGESGAEAGVCALSISANVSLLPT